jgi:hypothetical protein
MYIVSVKLLSPVEPGLIDVWMGQLNGNKTPPGLSQAPDRRHSEPLWIRWVAVGARRRPVPRTRIRPVSVKYLDKMQHLATLAGQLTTWKSKKTLRLETFEELNKFKLPINLRQREAKTIPPVGCTVAHFGPFGDTQQPPISQRRLPLLCPALTSHCYNHQPWRPRTALLSIPTQVRPKPVSSA